MPRRVIFIQNPTDGGSHFRTIDSKSESGRPKRQPQPPRPGGGGTLFDRLGITLSNPYAFKKDGKGIKYQKGRVQLTGGAWYGTPESNWFINQEKPSALLPGRQRGTGEGGGPYQAPTFATFEPAKTVWGSLYYISQRIDPNTGQELPPQGTPGTLKNTKGFDDPSHEARASGNQPFPHAANRFGTTSQDPFPTVSGYWWNRPTPKKLPAIIDFLETWTGKKDNGYNFIGW
jgi:hypothetical protein